FLFPHLVTPVVYTLSLHDALPISTPDWVPLAAKMTALAGVVAVVLVASALLTIGYQLFDGYANIEPLLYAKGLGLLLVSFVLTRSEEHTSELQSRENLVCRLLLEK